MSTQTRFEMRSTWIAGLTAGLFAASTASAAVVADWSGEYGATGITVGFGAFSLQGSDGAWSPNSPISPDPGTYSYSAPAGKNATFYGGYGLYSDESDTLGNAQINGQNSDDTIILRAGGISNGTNTLVGVYVFNKSDFLSGGDSAAVGLDATSSYEIITGTNNNATNNATFHRMVVAQGGTYYISSATSFPRGNDPQDASDKDTVGFSGLTWQVYDPAGAGDLRASEAAGVGFAGTFDDIDAIGVYVETSRINESFGLRNDVGLMTFNATVIPEPASMALLGLGGLLMLSRRQA